MSACSNVAPNRNKLSLQDVEYYSSEVLQVAQTNVQLFNQLRRQGRGEEVLLLVHKTYHFAVTLYSGYFQASGKPFIAHGVGVASILAELGLPGEVIAAGLVHNIYGNGDFGDGLRNVATPARRRLLRDALGAGIEELLIRFREIRVNRNAIGAIQRNLEGISETDRHLLLMDLADWLEHYADCGIIYYGNSDWVRNRTLVNGRHSIDLAEQLGHPRLAKWLREAFASVEGTADWPEDLRSPQGQAYVKLVLPRSCKLRLWPNLRRIIRRSVGPLAPRAVLRRLKAKGDPFSFWRFRRRPIPGSPVPRSIDDRRTA